MAEQHKQAARENASRKPMAQNARVGSCFVKWGSLDMVLVDPFGIGSFLRTQVAPSSAALLATRNDLVAEPADCTQPRERVLVGFWAPLARGR
jgi:hypothetical protein